MTNLILNVYKFILMKRLLFAGLLGVITSLGLRAGEPTTMWPYLFDDFMEASIYSKSGNKGEAKVNIHLLRNDLHYLNGSQIYCPDNQNDIGRVVFADSTEFVRCENFFIEVLGETPQAILGRRTTGDFDRLLQGTGAYGTSSSTSAVDNLSSLQLGGIANLNYDMIRVERENGQTLPVSTRSMPIKKLFRSSCPNRIEKSSMYFLKRIRSSGVRSIICKRFLNIFLLF